MYSVFVVGSSGKCPVSQMFLANGWRIAAWPEEADLIQFTGGSDVNPAGYGEPRHRTTIFDEQRDKNEELIYLAARESRQPMAGICRGGQFLNVMAGGKLWQDVDNHTGKPHITYDLLNNRTLTVTSTHHQMMRPTKEAVIVGIAMESTKRKKMRYVSGGNPLEITMDTDHSLSPDIEVVLYPKLSLLCFQPHPEYRGGGVALQKWYFELINDHLMTE